MSPRALPPGPAPLSGIPLSSASCPDPPAGTPTPQGPAHTTLRPPPPASWHLSPIPTSRVLSPRRLPSPSARSPSVRSSPLRPVLPYLPVPSLHSVPLHDLPPAHTPLGPLRPPSRLCTPFRSWTPHPPASPGMHAHMIHSHDTHQRTNTNQGARAGGRGGHPDSFRHPAMAWKDIGRDCTSALCLSVQVCVTHPHAPLPAPPSVCLSPRPFPPPPVIFIAPKRSSGA